MESLLQTSFHDTSFTTCLMNASGVWCETVAELEELQKSAAGTFVTKTATASFRAGNPSPRCQLLPHGSLNSMGLPNQGIGYYLAYLTQQEVSKEPKRFLSVAGLSPDELIANLEQIQQTPFDGYIELNLSCPNIAGKPQIAYDVKMTQAILERVYAVVTKPCGVKLPPFFDMAHFDEMAALLNQFPLKFVTCINSIGNALVVDEATDCVLIKPKDGFGGLGGPVIKATALANVNAFYRRLRPDIAIIGCGGVASGRDVYDHVLCGAHLVQVGSELLREGPGVFARLNKELATILQAKQVKNLASLRGQLKTIS